MIQSKVGPIKSEEEENQTLYQQFTILQQDWDTFKNSNPRRQCSTGSNNINGDLLQFMNNKSPSGLMSSLQNKRSPYEGYIWKVRNNELAFDIIRERWEAIESGKLKGRRLFGDLVEREEICSGGFDLVEELSEVRSVGLHCCDDGDEIKGNCGNKEEVVPLVCDEKVERETMVEEREKSWMHGMAWFGIGFLVLFLLGIVSIGCTGGFVYENEVIIVPT